MCGICLGSDQEDQILLIWKSFHHQLIHQNGETLCGWIDIRHCTVNKGSRSQHFFRLNMIQGRGPLLDELSGHEFCSHESLNSFSTNQLRGESMFRYA